jgi:hypothetical protein
MLKCTGAELVLPRAVLDALEETIRASVHGGRDSSANAELLGAVDAQQEQGDEAAVALDDEEAIAMAIASTGVQPIHRPPVHTCCACTCQRRCAAAERQAAVASSSGIDNWRGVACMHAQAACERQRGCRCATAGA